MFDQRPNAGYPYRRRRWKFLLIPFGIAGIVLLLGSAVQYLWNNTLTPVTGVATLTFWQATGLLVLCRLLFGGFRGGRSGSWGDRRQNGPGPRIRERWMNMSDEERARFREEWRQRCRPRRRDQE